jgi:hypothetical protein
MVARAPRRKSRLNAGDTHIAAAKLEEIEAMSKLVIDLQVDMSMHKNQNESILVEEI